MANENSDWVEWTGGECPVPADTLVEVRIGSIDPTLGEPEEAENYFWEHSAEAVGADYQITAYRVVVS